MGVNRWYVFDLSVNEVNIAIDEEVMSEILGVPTEGTRSLRSEKGSVNFLKICGRLDDINIKNVNKKTMKGEYQMLFELVNKSLLPKSEKRTTVAGPNLFLMEILSKYNKVNLPAIVIEHIHTVMTAKDGKHGLAYDFWLNRVFEYFSVVCGKGKAGSVKQMFNITTLEDNECSRKRWWKVLSPLFLS